MAFLDSLPAPGHAVKLVAEPSIKHHQCKPGASVSHRPRRPGSSILHGVVCAGREASRSSTCPAPTDARPPAQSDAPKPLRRPVKICPGRRLFACARRQGQTHPDPTITSPNPNKSTPPPTPRPHPTPRHGTGRPRRAPRSRLAYNFPRLVSSSLSLLPSFAAARAPPQPLRSRVFYSIFHSPGGRAEPIQHAVRVSCRAGSRI